jgi:hypothetical protein
MPAGPTPVRPNHLRVQRPHALKFRKDSAVNTNVSSPLAWTDPPVPRPFQMSDRQAGPPWVGRHKRLCIRPATTARTADYGLAPLYCCEPWPWPAFRAAVGRRHRPCRGRERRSLPSRLFAPGQAGSEKRPRMAQPSDEADVAHRRRVADSLRAAGELMRIGPGMTSASCGMVDSAYHRLQPRFDKSMKIGGAAPIPCRAPPLR